MDATTLDALVQKWVDYYNVHAGTAIEPALVHAIIQEESSGNPNATRTEPTGHTSYGLMQLLDSTAVGLGFRVEQLLDPDVNIQAGVKYLSQLYQQYGDQGISAVVSAYNAGHPITGNQTYVERVYNFYLDQVKRIGSAIGGAVKAGLPFLEPLLPWAAAFTAVWLLTRRRAHR